MTILTSPHDLLSAIPFLVGFQPSDSIVLISLRDEVVDSAIRIDFPEQFTKQDLSKLCTHIKHTGCDGVIVAFYLPPEKDELSPVINDIHEELISSKIEIRESLVIKGDRWRSFLCRDLQCCPTEGSPTPILEDSQIAAEQVALGKPLPFQNAAAMSASISALPLDEELGRLISEIPGIDYSGDVVALQKQGAEAVIDFIADFAADGVCRDKKLIALVLVRLKDLQVRDFALGSVTEDTLDIYFNAWRWLLRLAPEGYVAPLANLFAAVAYEKGDGALAHRALDRAVIDDRNYAMTDLLRQVFSSGWPTDSFARLRAELHPRICDALFSGSMNS